MNKELWSRAGSDVLDDQLPLLRDLLQTARDRWLPADPIARLAVTKKVDAVDVLHDGPTHSALVSEAIVNLKAGHFPAALAWGKAAYVAQRRFAHCWLPFLDIINACNLLPSRLRSPHENGQSFVPRNIIQYWDNPNPPGDVEELINDWRDGTKIYQHTLICDIQARHFLVDCYGARVLRLYDAIEHVAGKSDLIRLAWLAEHGGVYIDADDRRCGNLDLLLPLSAGLVLNWSPGPPPCINNWFVATRPFHPMIMRMLKSGLHTLEHAAEIGVRLSPWLATGPGLYSMTLMDLIATSNKLSVELEDVFLQKESDYRQVVQPVYDLAYRGDKKGNWKLAY